MQPVSYIVQQFAFRLPCVELWLRNNLHAKISFSFLDHTIYMIMPFQKVMTLII